LDPPTLSPWLARKRASASAAHAVRESAAGGVHGLTKDGAAAAGEGAPVRNATTAQKRPAEARNVVRLRDRRCPIHVS